MRAMDGLKEKVTTLPLQANFLSHKLEGSLIFSVSRRGEFLRNSVAGRPKTEDFCGAAPASPATPIAYTWLPPRPRWTRARVVRRPLYHAAD